jgi:hypothetical protein
MIFLRFEKALRGSTPPRWRQKKTGSVGGRCPLLMDRLV